VQPHFLSNEFLAAGFRYKKEPRHDKGSAVGQPQRPDGETWQVALTRIGGRKKVHLRLTIMAGHVIMSLS